MWRAVSLGEKGLLREVFVDIKNKADLSLTEMSYALSCASYARSSIGAAPSSKVLWSPGVCGYICVQCSGGRGPHGSFAFFGSHTSYARVLCEGFMREDPRRLITSDTRTSSVFEKCLMCVLCDVSCAVLCALKKSCVSYARLMPFFFVRPFFSIKYSNTFLN